ncbi:MAG: Gfo/Idh/MocA family oxidoreductase [Pirellulales bacterium]
MAAKTINVGLVGYKFMGKAHSNAYLKVDKFFDLDAKPVMKAICGREKEGLAAFAQKFGWESYETSWEKLVARKDIDLIDIGAPGIVHRDIAVAAAENGKHVFCEKPLAFTLKDAREMLAAVRKAGVKHMVNFNYRKCPAVALAKQMIKDGAIGEIRHFRATYLQDWINDPKFPMNWRLRKATAGSGAHGDLNAHLVDLGRFLVGEIIEVVGMQKTFMTERPAEGTSSGLVATAAEGTEKVDVDDCTTFLAKFANGPLGTFEATRLAPGRKNYNRFEINGSLGSLAWVFEDMNVLEYYSVNDPAGQQGFRKIIATEGVHPYVGNWWPPGHILGYEHGFVHAVYDLLQSIANDKPASPCFLAGARCVAVLEAVDKSIKSGKWERVETVE